MKNDSQLVPHDFATTVKDIKLAILQARAKAARLANAEALKLYFFGWVNPMEKKAATSSASNSPVDNDRISSDGI